MSLVAMPADIQNRDMAGRKRSHGDFLDPETCRAVPCSKSEHTEMDVSLSDKENDAPSASLSESAAPSAKGYPDVADRTPSPLARASGSPMPTPATISTASTNSPLSSMANAPTQKAAGEPPKKKRMTAEEKAAKEAAAEAEKRKKHEERDQKRREKEEAEKAKAEQKAAKAADKAEKEQEKKQKAEEREKKKREKEEEEAKKARSQMKLTNMFNRTPVTPKKEPAKPDEVPRAGSAAKSESTVASHYHQLFKPFFVHEHVRLANTVFPLDDETREAKTRILDEYLTGVRERPKPIFDPLETLQIPYKITRGRVYPSVREIMTEFEGYSSHTPNGLPDLSTESQSAQIRHTLDKLKSVPMKSIKFREDVRPPYIGTVSGLPPGVTSLRKLARNPISRAVLPLNYDYDSEAEWQEEEGEDVDDLDDEEEEADMDEDMEDFLDDSEDVGPARLAFSGGMEPESTGPCWEDRTRKTAEPKLYKFRLEFILEPLEHHHSIDPFSIAYWETPKSKTSVSSVAPTISASASTATATGTHLAAPSANPDGRASNTMAPPPAPSDAFQALNNATLSGAKKSQQPLPPDMQEKLKELVRSMPNLSKVGVIELFAANHPDYPRGQIKTSFEALFVKAGKVFQVKGA